MFILDEPLRCRDRDSLIDFVINATAEQSVKLLILSRPMLRSQIESELKEKGADPIIREVDAGDIATFLARNYGWINKDTAKNLEKKCEGNFVIAILQAEYFKRKKRGGLSHHILSNRVEKYINDLAMRTGKNISDIKEILFILSLVTPLHAKTDVTHLELVLFAPENAALQEVLRMAYSGDSDLLFLSGEQYIFKYDLIANYLGQQFVMREKEIQRWIQKLLPYAPSRISINLFQIIEYDRELLTKIFSLLSTTWSYLNTIGGKTPEYFVAIQIFTFYLKRYSFFRKEKMDIQRWVECYKEISKSCLEKEIEAGLAQALVNATYIYANTTDLSKMEECLNELRSLYREHPEREVRERLAGGLRNATKGYVETAKSSKVKECLNELRSLYREHPEREVRRRLAGGLYNTTYMFTETKEFSKMEECLNELRSLYREHPEREVRRRLAMGLVNAILMYAETANFSEMEECLNELRSLYREHPEKEVRIELAKGLYNTTVPDYENTADLSKMEECLNELRSLYREHPEEEVGVPLAKGLYNAMISCARIHYTDLVLLYKLRSLLPEIPDLKKGREIEGWTIAVFVEILRKNKEPIIKETLHTMKSELSDVEFVLLMNKISDRLPWKVQKTVWRIIDSGQF